MKVNKTYIAHWCCFLDFLLFVGLLLAGTVFLLISISTWMDGWMDGGQRGSKTGSEQTGTMTQE